MDPPTTGPIRITGPDDVEALLAGEGDPGSIEVAVEPFSGTENEYWSRRLTRHYGACGCLAGAGTTVGGAVVLAGYLVARSLGGQGVEAGTALVGLLVVLGVGLVAKTVALLVARHRFRSRARQLQRAIERASGRSDAAVAG